MTCEVYELLSDLDSGLAQVHPPRQLFPHECVRVMSSLEHPLEGGELARREGGSVAARLLTFPVVAIQNAVFF